MKIAIIINKTRLTEELEKILISKTLEEKYNLTYDFFICEPQNIEAQLLEISKAAYNVYIIGGGDGTVRSALQILINVDCKIAILPLGSFNLLAKSLNYPTNIFDLLAIVKNGKTKQIDLVSVNNKIIINHAWIGFYYYVLKARAKHSDVLGKNRLFKIIFNAATLFKVLPIYHLTFKIDEAEMSFQTCLVYCGNNDFNPKLTNLGDRKTLSSGLISIIVLNCHTRFELFLCLLQLIFNPEKESARIKRFLVDELTISAKSNKINIVIDGELFKLDTPLHFVNEHKTLTMIIP